jgi:hypothetical protein
MSLSDYISLFLDNTSDRILCSSPLAMVISRTGRSSISSYRLVGLHSGVQARLARADRCVSADCYTSDVAEFHAAQR